MDKDTWYEFGWPDKENTILCGLCGNTGKVDTIGKAKSEAGVSCGVIRYCICPNGRVLKRIAGERYAR